MSLVDGSTLFVFNEVAAPLYEELMSQNRIVFLPEGDQVAQLNLTSHNGNALTLKSKVDEY